jgi:hypothetical protein
MIFKKSLYVYLRVNKIKSLDVEVYNRLVFLKLIALPKNLLYVLEPKYYRD